MTADIITVLAVVAGIIWLGVMLVSALRSRRGAEEVPQNLRPGIDDQRLETRRLETGQKAAIAFSAFLAISLPLYFLGETNRQEGFVEEFDEAQVERGEHLAEEFQCFNCHGPLGVGGTASYVEKRSGVTVTWTAPSLDDVLYRYGEDELTFWITFGRGNTPMPAWGLAGGGPMNENQVADLVAYLATIQVKQQEAVDKTVGAVSAQVARLEGGEAAVVAAIVNQEQVIAEIDQAPADLVVIEPLTDRATEILEEEDQGLDTDDDGLSDAAEAELSAISAQAVGHFRVLEPVTLDPQAPDADLVDQGLDELEVAAESDPILSVSIVAINAALDRDEISEESPDSDGDGISDGGEAAISGLFAEASAATIPDSLAEISLDPTNPESVTGVPDASTASSMVGGLDTVTINIQVTVENEEGIRAQQEGGLAFLQMAQEEMAWQIDISGVAEAMETNEEEAQRAVALFNANCARCHTAGFSAGVPYTQEAGSGGFGPALWDGRPVVQFGEAPQSEEETDLLIDFLTKGSEAETPYGLNGFGTGRMPAFGAILDPSDLELLARYLRAGNMDGIE